MIRNHTSATKAKSGLHHQPTPHTTPVGAFYAPIRSSRLALNRWCGSNSPGDRRCGAGIYQPIGSASTSVLQVSTTLLVQRLLRPRCLVVGLIEGLGGVFFGLALDAMSDKPTIDTEVFKSFNWSGKPLYNNSIPSN